MAPHGLAAWHIAFKVVAVVAAVMTRAGMVAAMAAKQMSVAAIVSEPYV